jgi:hypothetical protein
LKKLEDMSCTCSVEYNDEELKTFLEVIKPMTMDKMTVTLKLDTGRWLWLCKLIIWLGKINKMTISFVAKSDEKK